MALHFHKAPVNRWVEDWTEECRVL